LINALWTFLKIKLLINPTGVYS